MFYGDFFVQKYFGQLFYSHSLALKFFGAKILAQKLLILMKLTTVVNSTNILQTGFSQITVHQNIANPNCK